jgi:hypothetical protein
LRSALLLLNGATSHLWTAKCDAWTSSAEQGDEPFDPYEMDAEPGETAFGAGSYIDLLPRDFEIRQCFDAPGAVAAGGDRKAARDSGERGAGGTCLRRAEVEAVPGFGVTWFVEGCGATAQRAGQKPGVRRFDLALAVIMDVRRGLDSPASTRRR